MLSNFHTHSQTHSLTNTHTHTLTLTASLVCHQVTLTPVDFNDKEIPYFAQIAEVNGNDPQTICGCIPDDPTGSPTNFQVYQFKGHVLFKWSDESQCEDAFAFTRNGVGLAARFPVTEQLACSSIQEPLTIYDDLTIQSSAYDCACTPVIVFALRAFVVTKIIFPSFSPRSPPARFVLCSRWLCGA